MPNLALRGSEMSSRWIPFASLHALCHPLLRLGPPQQWHVADDVENVLCALSVQSFCPFPQAPAVQQIDCACLMYSTLTLF